MTYPCKIKEQTAQPYLAIRTRTPAAELPVKLGESYGAIGAYLAELGGHPAGMPFVAYYNQDMADLDVEMGIPTAEVYPDRDPIYGAEIPAGRVAQCVYTGPYSGLTAAYEQLEQYVLDQGLEPSGLAYEHYIDDPGTTPEAALRTLIVFPLK